MTSAYGRDLAYVHDAGYGDFARRAAPALLEILRDCGIRDGLIVDLGCGSGIWAQALVSAGYSVLGIDQSAAMLELARLRAPQAEFRRGSLWRAELPACAAVTAIGECFNYLFDRANTRQGLARLLRRIYAALVPGGVLVFDVATPGRVPPPGVRTSYREGEGWLCVSTSEEDEQRRLLTRRSTTFRRVGRLYRREDEVHRLRLFTRGEISGQLRGAGFTVRRLPAYGEMKFPPGYIAFAARKPRK